MLKETKMNDLKIILNGKEVEAGKGETILSVAKRNNISIPTMCHDPRLEPYSSCFVCVVEVEGMRGLQPSCSTPVSNGMTVVTESKKIRDARKTALDLLLSNHYADCIGPCKQTCPAGVDVQGYVSLIEKGLYREAVSLIKDSNPLPAICGRVCVRPCEVACRRNLLNEGTGVGVDYMKRFAADRDMFDPNRFTPILKRKTGKNVAVIGAGPGGLSAAYWLQENGHQCDIYEAAPKPGGWLRYGIPEYRLPNAILDKEVEGITSLGVRIFTNSMLGGNIKFADLNSKYDAFILAPGSQKGTRLGCPGDEAPNVFPGIDFLKQMELSGKRADFRGKTVVVVGGGNTAMDCCRTSIRCGAEKVYVVYRRTEKEMPANPIEIHESKLEGVEYLFLTNPTKVNHDKNGNAVGLNLIKMELGEPDASGRRRPVEVPGSEFDLNCDVILAAIGQKTELNFLDSVNSVTKLGELKPNKWGDIDVNRETLQTGVVNIFAAGDGVSGPATIIEAIAQAKIAARSCHQYLTGEKIEPAQKIFISRKDNFRPQSDEEYVSRYASQKRQEMPVLDPKKRFNFEEVELGYTDEKVARQEADRCLECGCVAFFDCDLQKYASEYGAVQEKYKGEFAEFNVDFSHPFIELDRNKCILCGRCVRICSEVAGASALGLVNRGFITYVAPSMGKSLTETDCEHCGLCLSTCPTGALTENVRFKPGPVEATRFTTIDFLNSEGCSLELSQRDGFFLRADGTEGLVNTDGNIGRHAKFGYNMLNMEDRITTPMMKKGGKMVPVSFEEAYDLIIKNLRSVDPDNNLFFAGARLTNEEIYLIQKLARGAVKTNNVGSFHFMNRVVESAEATDTNLLFSDLDKSTAIFLVNSDLRKENQYVGFLVHEMRMKGAKVNAVTSVASDSMKRKSDIHTLINDDLSFILAVNKYIIDNKMYNQMFITDHCEGFEDYKRELEAYSMSKLCKSAGVTEDFVSTWSKDYVKEISPALIYNEANVSCATAGELRNLVIITGRMGKTGSGIICLRSNNNSQGLIDMGMVSSSFVGGTSLSEGSEKIKALGLWNGGTLPVEVNNIAQILLKGEARNLFIFGEDPVGTSNGDASKWKAAIEKSGFVVVMDYFMTETAKLANIILPASFAFETGGSFTNTQKFLQGFKKEVKGPLEKNSLVQLSDLLHAYGMNGISDPDEILSEAHSFFTPREKAKLMIAHHKAGGDNSRFESGADALKNRFEEFFWNSF